MGHSVLMDTWIPGCPRGFGGNRDWRETVAGAVDQASRARLEQLAGTDRLAVTLEFHVWPESSKYQRMNLPHGTDLDNLVKETIDAVFPHGAHPSDSAIYGLEATKRHVDSDDRCGVRLIIRRLDD